MHGPSSCSSIGIFLQGPGAVTLKVLSQVRNAGLVLAGIVLYSEKVNTVQAGGYLVSLIAFGAYSALESSNSKSAHNNGKGDVSAAAEPKSAKEKTSS